MEAKSCLARPAPEGFYSIAGRFIFVDTSDEWCAGLFERAFENRHASPVSGSRPPRIDCTIKLRRVKQPLAFPQGLESFEVPQGGRCYMDASGYYIDFKDSLIFVHGGNAKCVEAWINERLLDSPPTERAAIVYNVVGAALRCSGLLPLHGGAVVGPGDAGVLILGPSGSGKSTLTLQLAAEGWNCLSDDSLLIYETGNEVLVRGLRSFLALTEETIASSTFEKLRDVNSIRAAHDPSKRRFELQELFPEGLAAKTSAGTLFFPVITNETKSRVARLSQFKTLSRLLKLCPWACYDRPTAKQHVSLLTRLVRQTVAFDLRAGRDLLGDSHHTARLFESWVSEAKNEIGQL